MSLLLFYIYYVEAEGGRTDDGAHQELEADHRQRNAPRETLVHLAGTRCAEDRRKGVRPPALLRVDGSGLERHAQDYSTNAVAQNTLRYVTQNGALSVIHTQHTDTKQTVSNVNVV